MKTLLLVSALAFTACAARQPVQTGPAPLPDYTALVTSSDRSPEDRALDPGRKPVAFLQFMEVAQGMRVADLGAGLGYTTELLARAVGPSGVVYAQNQPALLQKIGPQPLVDRLGKWVNKNVKRVDRDFDDPLPPDAIGLDLVVMNVFYHDTVWLNVDRDKMNRAIFAALRPGGRYVVVDSSAKAGDGVQDVQTLHRIDEQVVRDEVARAGFKLFSESDFLRNPQDARDWNSSPRASGQKRGTSDRFVLAFMKP